MKVMYSIKENTMLFLIAVPRQELGKRIAVM
jgi:hypothetical protein